MARMGLEVLNLGGLVPFFVTRHCWRGREVVCVWGVDFGYIVDVEMMRARDIWDLLLNLLGVDHEGFSRP